MEPKDPSLRRDVGIPSGKLGCHLPNSGEARLRRRLGVLTRSAHHVGVRVFSGATPPSSSLATDTGAPVERHKITCGQDARVLVIASPISDDEVVCSVGLVCWTGWVSVEEIKDYRFAIHQECVAPYAHCEPISTWQHVGTPCIVRRGSWW